MTLTLKKMENRIGVLEIEVDGTVEEVPYQTLRFHEIRAIYDAEGLQLPIPPVIAGQPNPNDPEYQSQLTTMMALREMAIAGEMFVLGGSFVEELQDLTHLERAETLLNLPMPYAAVIVAAVRQMTAVAQGEEDRLVRRFRTI